MSSWAPPVLAALAGLLVAAPPVGRARLGTLEQAAPRRPWAVPWPALAGLAGFLALGPVAAALAALGVLLGRRRAAARRTARAVQLERARAHEALAVLAGDLRSGRSPAEALAASASVAVGATRRALEHAASAARLGGSVPAALTEEPCPVHDALRPLAACWSVCVEAGSGLAVGVERLADGLRAAEAQRQLLAAELAGPRATAALLAALPLAGLGMAGALGADPLHVLLHTPIGIGCLLGGLALDGVGLWWTRRLVAGAGPR